MPNWVANRVYVFGSKDLLDTFAEQASKTPITTHEDDRESVLSFANFIAPPREAIDSGEYHATNGFENGKETGNTPNNWYNFNNREWGTKWDACNADLERLDGQLSYGFETAWDCPMPVFEAMVEQFPKLEFEFWWEEEQGWGGEATGCKGLFSITDSWDIPNSHADYVGRDNEDGCICNWEDDQDEWYKDCPRDEAEPDPKAEQAEKLRQQIIEKTGVSKEWADSHLEVIL